ncbi:MAG: hypothetical protein WCE23_05940 [Candidatus Binatus sp.]|uniref:hypothetical protein n=1 Tax=Candidatus Binatus sp. TaxID=2811406 RepID=UPI003C712AB9
MSTRPARLIVAIFAALAMTVLVSARAAFSQDAEDSAAGADVSLEGPGPALDADAETADKVLEIPQAACATDDMPVACADGSDEDADAGGVGVHASSPGAPPSLDDDTADASSPNGDWGTLADYQNEPAYGVPYAVYGSTVIVVAGTMNRPWQLSASPFAAMSNPLMQAARPPLNPGLLMNSPWMPGFNQPLGNPTMGMMMTHGSFGPHHFGLHH